MNGDMHAARQYHCSPLLYRQGHLSTATLQSCQVAKPGHELRQSGSASTLLTTTLDCLSGQTQLRKVFQVF